MVRLLDTLLNGHCNYATGLMQENGVLGQALSNWGRPFYIYLGLKKGPE
jgi:hypothetical protein